MMLALFRQAVSFCVRIRVCALLCNVVVALLTVGCQSAGTVAGPSSPACSAATLAQIEQQVGSGDGQGHGPDTGSDEWYGVIEFRLGLRGEPGLPAKGSPAWCERMLSTRPAAGADAPATAKPPAPNLPPFRCDGRTRCEEMTSCAEAVFFLTHCPTAGMDDNGDGVPCEKQWCGSAPASYHEGRHWFIY